MQTSVSPALSLSVLVCDHTCPVRDPLIRVLSESCSKISLAITAAHGKPDQPHDHRVCVMLLHLLNHASALNIEVNEHYMALNMQCNNSVHQVCFSETRESDPDVCNLSLMPWTDVSIIARRDAIASSFWDICFFSPALNSKNHLACVLCNFKALPFMEMHQSLLKAFSS